MELNYNDFLHARGIENKERKGAPSTRGPASSPGEPRGTKTSQHKAVKKGRVGRTQNITMGLRMHKVCESEYGESLKRTDMEVVQA